MLFGLGARDGEGAGDNWAGLGRAGFSVTGLGGFGALTSGTVTKAGDSRSGIGTPSAGP